jgi:hypothetical protein
VIIRELLSVFGIDYDPKGQRQVEQGIATLESQFTNLAQMASRVFTAAAVASPLILLAKLASDANENLNLIEVSFGESADAVVRWADTAGDAMGRSRFTMRELAAEFGGFLRPMVGVGEGLVEMSTQLAQVAVDLSSIRNISESDAMRALQSGISGNIIAVKKFGVDLRAARVEAEALRMGINKSTKEMSQAELAAVRYSLIMKDLAFVSGDAANTQFGFANSTRALRDQLKDVGTDLGLFFLPAIEDGLRAVRAVLVPIQQAVRAFGDWARETNLAEGALSAIGLLLAFTIVPLLFKMLLVVAPLIIAMSLFAVVMDEVITTFKGGDSLIGRFTKALDELERDGLKDLSAPLQVLVRLINRFRDALGGAAFWVVSLVEALATGDWKTYERNVRSLGDAFDAWLPTLGKVGRVLRAIFALISGDEARITVATEGLKNLFSKGRIQIPTTPGQEAGVGAGAGPAGLARRAVTINQNGATFTFNIEQQPGENTEDFAQRVRELVDESNTERNQGIANELAPEPGG